MSKTDDVRYAEFLKDLQDRKVPKFFFGRAYKLYLSEEDSKIAFGADLVDQAMTASTEKTEKQNENIHSSNISSESLKQGPDEANSQMGESEKVGENILHMDKEEPIATKSHKIGAADDDTNLSANDKRLASLFRSQNPEKPVEFDPAYRQGVIEQLVLSNIDSNDKKIGFLRILNLPFLFWEKDIEDKYINCLKKVLKEDEVSQVDMLFYFASRVELFDKKIAKEINYQDLLFQHFVEKDVGDVSTRHVFWWTIGKVLCEVKTERNLEHWLDFIERVKSIALQQIRALLGNALAIYEIDAYLFFVYRYITRQENIEMELDKDSVMVLISIYSSLKSFYYGEELNVADVCIARSSISNIRRYIKEILQRSKFNRQVLKSVFIDYKDRNNECFKHYINSQIVNFLCKNPIVPSERYPIFEKALKIDSENFLAFGKIEGLNDGNIGKNLSHLLYNIQSQNGLLGDVDENSFYNDRNIYDTLEFSYRIIKKADNNIDFLCKCLRQIIQPINGQGESEYANGSLEFFIFCLSLSELSALFRREFIKSNDSIIINCDKLSYEKLLKLCVNYCVIAVEGFQKPSSSEKQHIYSQIVNLFEYILLVPISEIPHPFNDNKYNMLPNSRSGFIERGLLLYENRKIEKRMKKVVLVTIDKLVGYILEKKIYQYRNLAKSFLDLIARMAENRFSNDINLFARTILRKYSIYGRPEDGFDFIKDPPVITKKTLSKEFKFDFSVFKEKEKPNPAEITADMQKIRSIIPQNPYGGTAANEKLLVALQDFYHKYKNSITTEEMNSYLEKQFRSNIGENIIITYQPEELKKLFAFDPEFVDVIWHIIQKRKKN